MKRLAFFIFFTIVTFNIFAQNKDERKAKRAFKQEQQAVNWNFKYENEKVYWQKVFNFPDADSLSVIEYFNNQRYFTKVGDQYYTKPLLAEYNDKNTMHEPIVFQSTCDLYFYFQINKGRYRITVTDIKWKGNVGTVGFIAIMQEANLSMQDFIDNLNKYSDQPFKKSICKETNACLLNLFNYQHKHKLPTIINDDF